MIQVCAPFKITMSLFFLQNSSCKSCLSKSQLTDFVKRSNSFGCGVKIEFSGINVSQSLFKLIVFNASASITKGFVLFSKIN